VAKHNCGNFSNYHPRNLIWHLAASQQRQYRSVLEVNSTFNIVHFTRAIPMFCLNLGHKTHIWLCTNCGIYRNLMKPHIQYQWNFNKIFYHIMLCKKRYDQHFDPYFGGRLNGRCYFSVKKSSHWEKKFQCVSSHLDTSDLGPSLDLDRNGHQSLFWFKLMQS